MYPKFLSAFLNMDFSKKMLFEKCKAAIGQANINAKELQNIEIFLPPIQLQSNYISFLQQLDKSKFRMKKCLRILGFIRHL